jgi:DNA-binding transcriptional ArsR family regulator
MIPDFVTPPPPTAVPKFSDELENLCKVPEAVLRAEIEIAYPRGVPPELKSLLREPSALLNEIAFLLNEFWHRAIAPDWQRLHCFLESEVLFRARAMALGGLDAVFQGLHRCVIYRDGCLSVQTVSYWDGKRRKPGILLVPSIFGWPDAFLTVRPPWQPTVVYPARGIADLWTPNELPYSARLRRVLGSSRAKILARLQEPQTTKQISASLNISPPSVSEQIMNLRLAGILDRTRIGRNVFYSVNEKGKGLLAAFHV